MVTIIKCNLFKRYWISVVYSKSIDLYSAVMAVLLQRRLNIIGFVETDGQCVAFICTIKASVEVRPLQAAGAI